MRLWSLHPKYLDAKGIVAVWREGLLALAVLRGETKGYTRHPQLERFRREARPLETMKCYLWHVFLEAQARGYRFNAERIRGRRQARPLRVTKGQLLYELEHLRKKLKVRNAESYRRIRGLKAPEPHPLFKSVAGELEEWERSR